MMSEPTRKKMQPQINGSGILVGRSWERRLCGIVGDGDGED
jgi:hypothetical protein